jgi:ABC-type phosphate/phosphonate transport system substrate-binding protein
MIFLVKPLRTFQLSPGPLAGVLLVFLFAGGTSCQAQSPVPTLRIGTSCNLLRGANSEELAGLALVKHFFKTETGLDNDLVPQDSWRELAAKLAAKELPLGVFEGYEFAWAQARHPELKPLMLAVKGARYPVACVVVRKDDSARDFGDLAGRPAAVPATSRGFPSFFVERQAHNQGKTPAEFFGKISVAETLEIAVDEVVDKTASAAVVDRSGLEAYRQMKPGRFGMLREVAYSDPVLPVIIAWVPSAADQATIDRFRNGLLRASRQERGRMLLALFRLTALEDVPPDFDQMLAATRKAFPEEAAK